MPNWCYNRLEIDGPKDRLEAFEELVRTENNEFDFNAIIPYPAPYKQMDEEYPSGRDPEYASKLAAYKEKWNTDTDGYNYGGYDWCWDNWGTKWNASDVFWEDDPNRLSVIFHTAWSPPSNVIRTIIEKFPDLKVVHHYREESLSFYGCDYSQDGELIRDFVETDNVEYSVGDLLYVESYNEEEGDTETFSATYDSLADGDMINVIDDEGNHRVVSKCEVMLESYR